MPGNDTIQLKEMAFLFIGLEGPWHTNFIEISRILPFISGKEGEKTQKAKDLFEKQQNERLKSLQRSEQEERTLEKPRSSMRSNKKEAQKARKRRSGYRACASPFFSKP